MQPYRYYLLEQRDAAIIATFVDAYLQGEMLAELLRHELFEIADQLSPKVVVLDFRNVKIVSTSFISSLLLIQRRLGVDGTQLRLADMSDTLQNIFQTLRLKGEVLTIYATTDEALAGPVTYQDVVGRPTPEKLDDSDG
jgi:anti-anti-sigma regulatory factor